MSCEAHAVAFNDSSYDCKDEGPFAKDKVDKIRLIHKFIIQNFDID